MTEPAASSLGCVRAVTYAVADLDAVQAGYVDVLGYRLLSRAQVRADQAIAWGAPAVEGRPMITLGPASGEAVFLRFVECRQAAGWRALTSLGWNATEFVVQDVDALAQRLAGGGFDIIGPPASLTRFPMIRAMQAIGPAGECCYFTQVGEGSGLDLAPALSFVGRVFIVVAAGWDVDRLSHSYARFANAIDPPVATPVRVISKALGLAEETLHRHCLVRLPAGTLIELDEYPRAAPPRAAAQGELPPGMAIVSFDVAELGGCDFIAPAAPCGLEGRQDAPAACLRGAAGELIELVAATTPCPQKVCP